MLVNEAEIGFENAMRLLDDGIRAIDQGDGIMDLQNVKKVDSSAIAIALGWLRHAEYLGRPLKLINQPAAFNKLLDLYGLSKVFD